MLKKRETKIRSINKDPKRNEKYAFQHDEFPLDTPGVIYVRQSSIAQVQKNLHSFEMQTEKFIEFFRMRGVTKHIEVIADDEGLSGTLDIHDRKGLTRVMRLVEGKELLEGERAGWIAGVYVNRFTRDKWLITPGILMKTCFENNVWIATLRANYNFKETYSRRLFMLEAEESAKYLEWMRDILDGGKQAASDKGIYGGRYVLPGYIVDYREKLADGSPNPTHKKYIVYEPHAKGIRWLFRRFLELDGNLPELCREVEALPYLFPAFEKGIDERCLVKFSAKRLMIKEGRYKGCYRIGITGIIGILTNPVYLGWWVPVNGGKVEKNHPVLTTPEIFAYTHMRLSSHNLEGERQRPERVSRNGKVKTLLKKVVFGPNGAGVYPRFDGPNGGKPVYAAVKTVHMGHIPLFTTPAIPLDEIFSERLKIRLAEWEKSGELNGWKDSLEERLDGRRERKQIIQMSIAEAQAGIERIDTLLTDPEIVLAKTQIIKYNEKRAGLERKLAQYEADLKGEDETEKNVEEDEDLLFQIWELIPKIQEHWADFTFEERIMVVNAFTRSVALDAPTPGWLKVEIMWKIGHKEGLHLRRFTNGTKWTPTEKNLLKEMYRIAPVEALLYQFPSRTWQSIRTQASKAGIRREKRTADKRAIELTKRFDNYCVEDEIYAEEHGLVLIDKNAQWSPPSG